MIKINSSNFSFGEETEINNLRKIVGNLPYNKITKEEYFNLIKFYNCLIILNPNELEIEGCIITPFYIDNGKRYEIYEYELFIEDEDGGTFEEYMENLTGRNFSKISKKVLGLRKNCFIKINSTENELMYHSFIRYLEFVMTARDLQIEVDKIFGSFDKANLFLAIYM